MPIQISPAIDVLERGGVIAYPTEYCFGLGCDPQNPAAIHRILDIKRRQAEQGVILVAATIAQIETYADLQASPMLDEILGSWPGPCTWLLPARGNVSEWVKGKHKSVAMRLSDHPAVQQLCNGFNGAIVSTSANRHGTPALMSASAVQVEMGSEVDYIVDAPLGGMDHPSLIRDGVSGAQIR